MKKISTVFVAVIATLNSYAQNSLEVIDTDNITRERWRDSVLRIDKAKINKPVRRGRLTEHKKTPH